MTIEIYLDSGAEKITNLAVADAIMRMCEDSHINILNPKLIAKAMLLQLESEDTE